jgi:hypothetical protein
MTLDLDAVECEGCGQSVNRVRLAQRYCSKRCRDNAAQGRRRHPIERSADNEASVTVIPVSASPRPGTALARSQHGSNPDGSTPGALQGDDYPLDYYADDYPKLPECLRRSP